MLISDLSMSEREIEQQRLAEIYAAYYKPMRALAKSLLHNDSDAEDVVQDVFVCIAAGHIRFILTISNETDVRNYLLKATKNKALNELKCKRRSNIYMSNTDEGEADSGSSEYASFVDVICTRDEYNRVISAILSMNELYKRALYYHFVRELTVSETATQLNRSAVTVKTQLVRGKRILKELWEFKNAV